MRLKQSCSKSHSSGLGWGVVWFGTTISVYQVEEEDNLGQ
jgi:hypothetical protein